MSRFPVVTPILVAVCVAVYALGVDPYAYGFVPAHPALWNAFTSLFLHADLWHLVGNVVGLAIFGTLVEREIGSSRFAALYGAAGLGGALFHWLTATTTLVGASGAIFGVLAAAGMLRSRLVGFVASFVAINVVMLLTSTGGTVAVGCHVGGFVAGFCVIIVMRPSLSERTA